MIVPFPVPITLHRRTLTGLRNSYGDPTWTDAQTVVYGAFYVGQNSGDNTATDLQPVIYLQPGTDVSWLDGVTIDGQLYEVDGNPNEWVHPLTGWSAGIEVHLRATQRPTP